MTATIIDTAARLTANPAWLPAIRAQHPETKTISRYLTRSIGRDRYKLLTRAEAVAITAAGLTIKVNYEGAGATPGAFTEEYGYLDGKFTREYCHNELGMPPSATVPFSSEARFDSGFINNSLIPYWRGIHRAMDEVRDLPKYGIDAYSAGSALEALVAHNLIGLTWVPNALDWPDSRKLIASGKWTMRQLPTVNDFVPGLDVDPNEINPAYTGSIGDFTMAGVAVNPAPVPNDFPTLRPGATGDAVVTLQKLLGITADGQFGPATEAAVKAFQSEYTTSVDGIVGPETWGALQAQQQGV